MGATKASGSDKVVPVTFFWFRVWGLGLRVSGLRFSA